MCDDEPSGTYTGLLFLPVVMIVIHELLQQNVIFPYPFWLKNTNKPLDRNIPMGKRYEAKNIHKNKNSIRESHRIRLTVLFLLREKLGLESNPDNLSEPQPLNLLEVITFLKDVIITKPGDDKGLPDTVKL